MGERLLRLVGVLMMVGAAMLALSQAPDLPVHGLVTRWGLPPSDFIDLRGQLVHLRDEGPREDPLPLVLLHGTADSLHTWEGWVRALKGRRRVIRLDLPGFGLTGPYTGQYAAGDYSGDAYARFLVNLLDALNIQRAVLVGHSLGGEVAWRTALFAPQRVAALVLVDASGLAGDHEPAGLKLARLPVLGHALEWILPRGLVEASLAEAYGDPAKVTPELVERYFQLTLRDGNRGALIRRLRAAAPGADAERLPTLKQPTLILWGERDRLIPPAVGRQFQERIAGSHLVVLDGLGHLPQQEDPAASVKPLQDFLAAAAIAPAAAASAPP
ncbi:alpha/beta fold hydrolase [Rubrivivax sp. A210]|uniref:alpha/beta fold hydrolase n=1 Tax=Rubrivivax sp. A210 TaxID=2772301 RepID=UPI001919D737|nr:alpha/beta fold hydrolase [Rubrivivax sp. A210]